MHETVITNAPEETEALAAAAAERLTRMPRERAFLVTLRGELGAGKTAFTQGLLGALGVQGAIASPTFLLMHRYPLAGGPFRDAYHVDAYRLQSVEELASLGLEAVLAERKNLVVVEWPEIGGELFGPQLDVRIEHGAHERERRITLNWDES
jgi:tRNA threonylcarbamoyladenosine biosynthesis protein TsaE